LTESRFLADEHVPASAVRALKRYAIDIVSTAEAGLLSHTDEEQLEFAAASGRVVVTHDRDFARLHAKGQGHAGIVLLWRRPDAARVVAAVRLVHAVLSAEEMRDRIEYL
jgi:predicted nuclease of predicted toxin-antitoxin system